MIELASYNYLALSGIIILAMGALFVLEFLLNYFFNRLPEKNISLRIMTAKVVEILFSLFILNLFGLLSRQLFSLRRLNTGLIFLGLGLGFALLVSYLSYSALKTGRYGKKYSFILAKTPRDRFFTLITFVFLVGPAEDLFFIGFVQNILAVRLGWISVLIYLLLFTFFHYLNVLSGVEENREFWVMLPIRLVISAILSVSFLLTGTIIYTLLIHNLFDTLNYLALLSARKIPEQKKREEWSDEEKN